MNVILRIKRD